MPGEFSAELLKARLIGQGFTEVIDRGGVLCAIQPFLFTTGLLVQVHDAGYARRYCYEFKGDAIEALLAWDGSGHPGGPWIKCKGLGINLLNPAFV